jgi:hypothetical protein
VVKETDCTSLPRNPAAFTSRESRVLLPEPEGPEITKILLDILDLLADFLNQALGCHHLG